MKRYLSIMLCFLMLVTLAFVVNAEEGSRVCFTDKSKFEAGGKVSVDETKTFKTIIDDPNVTSDIYNAYL